jgi:hypothetical protein
VINAATSTSIYLIKHFIDEVFFRLTEGIHVCTNMKTDLYYRYKGLHMTSLYHIHWGEEKFAVLILFSANPEVPGSIPGATRFTE